MKCNLCLALCRACLASLRLRCLHKESEMLLFVGSCLVAHRVGEVVGSPKGQHRLVGRYLVGKLDTSLVAHRAREVVLASCWLYKKFCKGLRPQHWLVGRCHSVCCTLCLTSHVILTLYCLSSILVFFALLSLHFFSLCFLCQGCYNLCL